MHLGMVACFILALLSKGAGRHPAAARHDLRAFLPRRPRQHDVAAEGRALRLPVAACSGLRAISHSLFWRVCAGHLTRNVTWYQAILSGVPLAGHYVWKMIWPVS